MTMAKATTAPRERAMLAGGLVHTGWRRRVGWWVRWTLAGLRLRAVAQAHRGFYYRKEAAARATEIALTRQPLPYPPRVSRY
jgi:hypothetical protein